MKHLITLRNQLIEKHGSKEANEFCGKLVSIMLYSGLDSIEAQELVSCVISCSILNRVCNRHYSKILELCPVFGAYMRTDHYGPRNISFIDFFNIVLEFEL